ncbi:MAG TPA: 2-oxoacid:acceptor oxidoreductase family protein [Bryobacteraceae bacterium]|jgi:pyruvate ferredoxin oxidoreductase gamma subunit
MFQVRIHGRGGQGVVTAAEILSIAAFLEGKHAQAFPTFGSERMGAPVTAFCRIDDHPIRLREPIVAPDALIIQDATLLHRVPLFDGLADSSYLLINSTQAFEELAIREFAKPLPRERCCTLPATRLGLEHVGRPIPNAALLGGFAAISEILTIDSIADAIRRKFSGRVGEKNVEAARAAYGFVMERKITHAPAG